MSELEEVPFHEYHKLVEKIKEKNIIVDDEYHAIFALKNHSYYSLINGFKQHFLETDKSDTMIDNTTFNDFTTIYYLYSDISSLIFKYILYIEKSLRSRLSHIIAREFGVYHDEYLDRNNYCNYKGFRGSTLNEIHKVIENCKENSVTHYFKEKKKNIPPWIIVQDVSFFTVISWSNILPKHLKEELFKDYFSRSNLYENHHERYFHHSFHFLREYRNFAAHGKRDFKEKIINHLESTSSKHFFGSILLKQDDLDNNRGLQDLLAAINLILMYTQDVNLIYRFLDEFIFVIIHFVNKDTYSPTQLINQKSIYQILNLPEDIVERIARFIQYRTIDHH
ncbi:Abi family protein [Aliicoccus persicus]|uniref:Abortive infection bacteriophage resistance protein n=1 Tax=Aliicoccus persicus TaxID=930138 RepID=A0A662Z3P4_9STAP|nr:Abi family protein [Aliicoccus persicus]SEW03644.1 Abortive infection bacteriophage resistance protein [Aliicoccus persicus]